MKVLMATMKMDIGGAETHILEAARALHAQGIEVVIASAGGVFEKELSEAGIRHIYAPLHTKKPQSVLLAYRILDKLLKTEHFDIIHAHARIPAVICSRLAKKHHIRYVSTAHLTFKVNALWRHLMNWGERSVAVSDDIKQYLIDEYGFCSDNVAVTINGINTETFSPCVDPAPIIEEFGLDPAKRRVVLVSRIDTDRSEAAVQLADIAPELHRNVPDAEILIVGGGDDFDRLKASADRANEAVGFPMVRLAGARTDISRCIAAGDVFIGVSRAALEAMAMAKPVILAGNEGYLGIYETAKFSTAYDSNFCCRGCAMTSREALCADLTALLTASPARLAELGEMGRSTVIEHYSVRRMAQDYLDMYEAVRPYQPFAHGDIIMCGYYGFRNMGDDSLLRAITANLRKIDPDVRITVMSKTPKETETFYGTQAINRFNPIAVMRAMKGAKVLIFGGGNLLQDGSSSRSLIYYTWILSLARRYGLKIMVYANGIGPLHKDTSKKRAAEALRAADRITLREADSYEFCKSLGIPEEKLRLTADPAFTLSPADELWSARLCRKIGLEADGKYFAVALRDWRGVKAADKRAEIAAFCDRIHDKYGYLPLFLPMHDPMDNAVNRECAAMCKCPTLFASGLSGSEMLSILSRMEFTAAMRLHTLIFSTAVGTPSIGLAYDSKLEAYLNATGQPLAGENVTTEILVSMADSIIADRAHIHDTLLSGKDGQIAAAGQDAKDVFDLLNKGAHT